jgi:hypothetical protein
MTRMGSSRAGSRAPRLHNPARHVLGHLLRCQVKHQRLTSAIFFLSVLLSAPHATADPIGTLEVFNPSLIGVGGFSEGSVIVVVATAGYVEAAADCYPCTVGTTTSFSGMFSQFLNLISLTSPTFTIPLAGPPGVFTVQMPFSFDAFGEEGTISGDGTVTGTFRRLQPDPDGSPRLVEFQTALYVAGQSTEAPVPEPASMLLIGTGLVGLGARRWRDRRR